MKSIVIEQNYHWRTRFSLTKEDNEFILKIKQYKLKKYNDNGGHTNEIHLFSGDVVRKLKDFLNKEV
jgi:hypothetical protein